MGAHCRKPVLSIWTAIILGLLQGLTEFLPVSSSGHLAVASKLFRLDDAGQNVTFAIALHAATLAAVAVAMRTEIVRVLAKDRKVLVLLGIGTVPAIAAGIVIKFFAEELFNAIGTLTWLVGIFFIVTGVVIFLAERLKRGDRAMTGLGSVDALIIGVIQVVAFLPGISRSGMTISGGYFRGLAPGEAVSFSFLLGIVAIAAAAVADASQIAELAGSGAGPALICGVVAAFVAGLCAVWVVKRLARARLFYVFSIYLVAAGLAAVVLHFAL